MDSVCFVTQPGYTKTEATRNLGIDSRMLGRWVRKLSSDEAEAFRGNGTRTEEQEELRALREDNQRLNL